MSKTENEVRPPRSRVASAGRTRAKGAEKPQVPEMKPERTRRARAAAAAPPPSTEDHLPVAPGPARRKGRRGAAPEVAGTADGTAVIVGAPDAESVPVAGAASEAGADADASAGVAPEPTGVTPTGDDAALATPAADPASVITIVAEGATETQVDATVDACMLAASEQAAPSASGRAPTEEPTEAEVAAAVDAALNAVPQPVLTGALPGPLRCMVRVQALKAVLGVTAAALPTRTTLPVLSTVMLATNGEGHLRLTATDLDTTVAVDLVAVIEGAGAVLVNGKKLHEIVKELPDGCTLNFSIDQDVLVLVCDGTRSRFRLATLPVDEFPSPPAVRWDEDGFDVEHAVLSEMIGRTSFAVSDEDTRPILNGVLWELRPDGMTMVATNGHRLSSAHVPCDCGRTDDLILAPRALSLVAGRAGPRALVRVAHTQNHAGFRGDGWEILTRLTEGPYPQWRQVVPQDNDLVLTADRVTLMAAVRRMAIFADDKTHRIRLSLSGSTLAFSAWSSGVGTGSEEIAVDYVGEPLEIGFNALYLLDVLKYISTGEVKLTFKAPERAATLHPVGGEGVIEHDVLVMPLRLL